MVISKVMPACVRNPLAPLLSLESWSVSPDLSPCPCIHDTQTAVVAGLCGDGTAIMYLMVLAEASSRWERRAPLVPVLPARHCEERRELSGGWCLTDTRGGKASGDHVEVGRQEVWSPSNTVRFGLFFSWFCVFFLEDHFLPFCGKD